jgi:hypothetical protein
MTAKTVEFSVRITYETEDGSPICEESAKENLYAAIENERMNGALTPDDVSALHVSVEVKED